MFLQPYGRVLALPRVRTTLLVMFFARLPLTATSISLTLHVVSDLHRGYGEAGLVGTATTVGAALGAPVLGRVIDRYGQRSVVVGGGICSASFWVCAPHLPYAALVMLAFPAGMIAVPVHSLARQFLTALVPREQRRAAFSLDTILVETSFIIGPTVAILVITRLSTSVALTGIGVWLGLMSCALYVMNLPTHGADEARREDGIERRPRLRSWLDGRLLGTLVVVVGALFTLMGTEIAVVGAMRADGQVAWTGAVMGAMSAASIAGGLVHGAVRRSLPQGTLALLLGVLLVPVGLFARSWWSLSLALVPMNLMCTPTLAASSETISNLAPQQVRGEAMGLQDSASRLGMALGSPAVGFAIDHTAPGWGFATAGIGGLVLTGAGVLLHRRSSAALRRTVRAGRTNSAADQTV